MKTRYLLSLIAGASMTLTGAVAQTNLTQAVDFTVTDVNGNVHNLFNILNNGQHVCIDFFFDTCGPCQVTSPYFKQTYNNFGCNNEDVFFIAIDLGDTDAQVIAYENTFLGGAPGYPSVSGLDGGGNAVVSAYGIGAYPTYILIQPDQTIIEQDMWPISNASTFTNYLTSHGLSQVPCSPVGINYVAEQLNVTVYPNPASEFINVRSDEAVQHFRITNLVGATVVEGVMPVQTKSMNRIDVSHLTSGIYLLELTFKSGSGKFKFAK